ncbi:MAG: aminoglycoside phosphotransferase family protein [Chloroflexi bacterium]|nr:aminoglycoside phosphotransferase family protein [Chloroflexota bacterium]MCI0580827.1 aminoglycoside phosphotransferase family protein [Chloroflexota bacterium]MCI0648179.1 aminoglycoside phosphotransferase family protein [Chloroflexota bacterium]MCI0730321.1 aminoglycoside phosphotransferase family protein [Chloroflexota bacterium]
MSDEPVWRSTIYLILPRPQEAGLWLQPGQDGYGLPHFETAGGFWETRSGLERQCQELLGAEINLLYRAHYQEDIARHQAESIFVVEPHRPPELQGGRWVALDELDELTLARPDHLSVMESYLREVASGDTPPGRPPWARPGWYAQATAWIVATLNQQGYTLAGPAQVVRNWSISCVMRAPTNQGDFYFKTSANLPLFVNEAAVTSGLAGLFPEAIPQPLAVDRERNWMLLPDFGRPLREQGRAETVEEMLCRFGRLQIASAVHVEELLALGCLDRRLEWLASQVEPLLAHPETRTVLDEAEMVRLAALAPRLQEMIGQLTGYRLPCTLIHGDLHAGNVAGDGRAMLFFDWTDAAVAHPFVDMLEIFYEKDPAQQARLRESYLSLWTPYEPAERLQEVWRLVEVLAPLYHATSYLYIVANIEPAARRELVGGLRHWLHELLNRTAVPAQ